jgi:hypothetical protein
MKVAIFLVTIVVEKLCLASHEYKLRASIKKPENFTLVGEVGQVCLDKFWNWQAPFEDEKSVPHHEFLSILPANFSLLSPGVVFKPPNENFFLKLLAQIDPTVRKSRYDPLDPNVRSSEIAYGILRSVSKDEFEFNFRSALFH